MNLANRVGRERQIQPPAHSPTEDKISGPKNTGSGQPPHSLPPARVLTVHSAAGGKA